ncbi:MAG TPA: hypothetical protein VFB76_07955 [Candidatus Angelobacter sp.]|nr:hypothetical protein [Candidatus Angelobacter sp.]
MASYTPAPISYPILRNGQKLVIPAAMHGESIALPPPCIKCGDAATGKPVNKTFFWHHPAYYLLLLPGGLFYILVALIVRKRMRLTVPLCARHAQRRRLALTLAWVCPLVGMVGSGVMASFDVDGGLAAVIGILLVVTGAMIWGG